MVNKKKILFFLQSGVGGAERVTVTIAKLLDLNKYDLTLALLTRTNGEHQIRKFIPDSFKVIEIQNKGGFSLYVNLVNCIRKNRPDIVFSSMMFVNTKILAASFLFPHIRFIVRNNNYLYTLSFSQKLLLKISYRFADMIVAQTDEMRDELINVGLSSKKIITLQNPVDTDYINEKAKEKSPFVDSFGHVFVASGRFHPVKGFDVLVEAFYKVLQSEPNAKLYIIGKNNDNCLLYYKSILTRIYELGIENSICCVGFQDNPYKYVRNADCFVLSSRNEGLPNVLIEALYLETPVAATSCIPIIERIVDEGSNGYTANVEDPDSLSLAMINAAKLGRVKSSYKSASNIDFQKLFE